MFEVVKKSDIALLQDDSIGLLIESWSSSAQTVQIRGFNENTQIALDHTTNSDRTKATSEIGLSALPTSLTVQTSATGVHPGQCYIRLYLTIEGVKSSLLMAGYVYDTAQVAFPNGKIQSSLEGPGFFRVITGTDPATGSEFSETVPTGARWRLMSLRISFLTSATVATRVPQLIYDDGTTMVLTIQCATGHTASTNKIYMVRRHNAIAALEGSEQMWASWPDLFLEAGWRIRSSTLNIQAGDEYGAPIYFVEEWLQP